MLAIHWEFHSQTFPVRYYTCPCTTPYWGSAQLLEKQRALLTCKTQIIDMQFSPGLSWCSLKKQKQKKCPYLLTDSSTASTADGQTSFSLIGSQSLAPHILTCTRWTFLIKKKYWDHLVWFLLRILSFHIEPSLQSFTKPWKKSFPFCFKLTLYSSFPSPWVYLRFKLSFLSIFKFLFPMTIPFLPWNMLNFHSDCTFLPSCVATVQVLTGSRYSGRRKNIHGAVGMSDMPLFTGGWATDAVGPMFPCMSLCGTCRGPCSPAWHPAGSPYWLKY